ncbi:MAG: hypothetical protein AAFQ43_08705 [Bacteroidota bacterium]
MTSSTAAVGALVLASLALLVSLIAAFTPEMPPPQEAAEDESEVLTSMIRFQRYYEKAGAAAEAQNWPLAAFYAHEVEETAAHVAASGWVDDGVELGPLAERYAVPAAEQMHLAAEATDGAAFDQAMIEMAAACTVCHRQTDHPFLVIRPDASAAERYPSQDFAPEAPTQEAPTP